MTQTSNSSHSQLRQLYWMGNHNLGYSSLCLQNRPFRQNFPSNYKFVQHVVHERFGSIELYMDRYTQEVNLMVKDIALPSKEQLNSLVIKLERRIKETHPGMLQIYDYIISQIEDGCGSVNSLKVFVEFIDSNMKREIRHRKKYKDYWFCEEQVHKILYDLTLVLSYMHDSREFHGEIKMTDVLVDKSNNIRLIDKIIGVTGFKLTQVGQNLAILKGKGILFAPSIMRCLENKKTQISSYDPFKADIFSVGMVMLEIASYEDSELLYDYDRFLIQRERMEMVLSRLRTQYSSFLVGVLEAMLCDYDQNRPSARQVLAWLIQSSGGSVGPKFKEPLLSQSNADINLTFA